MGHLNNQVEHSLNYWTNSKCVLNFGNDNVKNNLQNYVILLFSTE